MTVRSPLDPVLAQVLEAVPFTLDMADGVEAARAAIRDLPRPPTHPEITAHDTVVPGPAGPIPVRVYRPPTAGATPPVVVFFHGGGFVVGDLDTHDGSAREHAAAAGAVVVSVDYRLAPENPFPAAVEDAWAATEWVAAHGDELGADTTRLAVAGDSAGGNLAAVVAQRARDTGDVAVTFQLLWYPVTGIDTSLPSFAANADAPILTATAVAEFSRLYAGDLTEVTPTLAPALGDLTGLPPAYVAVAGHDPLHDDGARYAALLAEAGVPVVLDDAPELVHGYLAYTGVVPAATAAVDRATAALRDALHRPTA